MLQDHRDLNEPAHFRHLVKFGTVSKISKDSAGRPYARVQYQDRGGVTTAPFQILQRNTVGTSDFHCPRVGEQVCVLHLGTGYEQGVIIGSVYTDKNASPVSDGTLNKRHVTFDDGSFVEFDPSSGKMTVNTNGDVDVTTAANLNATVGASLTALVTAAATVSAASITVNGPTTFTSPVTFQQGFIASGNNGSGKATTVTGDINVAGNITHTGNMSTTGAHTDVNGHHS